MEFDTELFKSMKDKGVNSFVKSKQPDVIRLCDSIKSITSFLDDDVKFGLRIWHVKNDMLYIPTCLCCGDTVYDRYVKNKHSPYPSYCSDACRHEGRKKPIDEKEIIQRYISGEAKEPLAAEYDVSVPVINRILRDHKVEEREFGIDQSVWDSLRDKEWCRKHYVEEKKPLRLIASELGCSMYLVTKHMFNIHGLDANAQIDQNIKDRLYDKEWLENEIQTKTLTQIAQELGVSETLPGKVASSFELEIKRHRASIAELEILDFIHGLGFEAYQSDTTILGGRKELDIVVPDANLAIEYNGLYWHSESMGKGKQYHLNKTLKAAEQGYELLHVMENEWVHRPMAWKSLIASKLGKAQGVYARKTRVEEVKPYVSKHFFDNNHVQGSASASYHFGLFQGDDLVACMSVSKARFGLDGWEVIRYANAPYKRVVGGFSRLLKHFQRVVGGGHVYSYANRRLSKGNVYEACGFELVRHTEPGYFYYRSKSGRFEIVSRYQVQGDRILAVCEDVLDGETERQTMERNGYHRIWDCGNLLYCKH